ncbi:MAG: enolase [Actinomycetota bacterium]|nr:enolase [Actinomycetota bacterium]
MRIVAATVYALEIPFVEAFRHSAHARRACDSVVLQVVDEGGFVGFGEGAPRPYVTGETPESVIENLVGELWPRIVRIDLPDPVTEGLAFLDEVIPEVAPGGAIAANAARCALELALVDCALRSRGTSLGALVPPRRRSISYSGVVTATDPALAARRASQMKLIGLEDVKLKVGIGEDMERVRAVREAIGPEVSLRLDANGGWDLAEALDFVDAVAEFGIAALEQPLPRHAVADLAELRKASEIPLVADESLVTLEDAEHLLAADAVDVFNVRISKCGGLHRSTRIAGLADEAGVAVQLGCHVGETAILSAAGRHLAAWAPRLSFAEGSYGTLLLVEDVSVEPVHFGHRGQARLLSRPGLGIEVIEERLRRYAGRVVELAPAQRKP